MSRAQLKVAGGGWVDDTTLLWIAKIPPGREMRLSIGPGDRFGRRFPFGTARCVTAEGTKRALRHSSLAIHLQLRREILATTTQAARS